MLIIATYDAAGKADAMNAAWGGQCAYHHVAPNLAKGHKTTENLRLRSAFTLSIANRANMVLSDYFGLVSGYKEDKIARSGVHVTKSEFVDAPVIEEYPLTLECRVVRIKDESGEIRIVGEVVNMQADETILNEQGEVDLDKLQPLSYDSSTRTYRVIGETVGTALKTEMR